MTSTLCNLGSWHQLITDLLWFRQERTRRHWMDEGSATADFMRPGVKIQTKCQHCTSCGTWEATWVRWDLLWLCNNSTHLNCLEKSLSSWSKIPIDTNRSEDKEMVVWASKTWTSVSFIRSAVFRISLSLALKIDFDVTPEYQFTAFSTIAGPHKVHRTKKQWDGAGGCPDLMKALQEVVSPLKHNNTETQN